MRLIVTVARSVWGAVQRQGPGFHGCPGHGRICSVERI